MARRPREAKNPVGRKARRSGPTVLFDLGDVLATFDPACRLRKLASRCGLPPNEVKSRLERDDFWASTDLGRFSTGEMHDRISDLLDHDFTRAELLELQACAFTVRHEVVAVASEVARSARVGILTNNAPLLEAALPHHFPELHRVFDPILFSFQFGAVKPDSQIFRKAGDYLDVPAQTILLIDDQARNVNAARIAGWQAVQFESATQIRRQLTELGILGARPH